VRGEERRESVEPHVLDQEHFLLVVHPLEQRSEDRAAPIALITRAQGRCDAGVLV